MLMEIFFLPLHNENIFGDILKDFFFLILIWNFTEE